MTISEFFLCIALIEVTTSGSDVPMATTVRPKNESGIPNKADISSADSTVSSAPHRVSKIDKIIIGNPNFMGFWYVILEKKSFRLISSLLSIEEFLKLKITYRAKSSKNKIPVIVLNMNAEMINKKSKWLIKWKLISNLDIFFGVIFEKASETPNTSKILEIFEPMIFPTDRSGEFLITASIDTNNSASEVPKPTTMRPIKKSDTLNFFPRAIELESKKSAPFTRSIKPNIKIKVWVSIF